MPFTLSSTDFSSGGVIPKQFTCDGEDRSPELSWSGAPVGTESFALIVDDPDAPGGTWTHWILWNVPATTTSLPAAFPKTGDSGNGARQGNSDFKRVGYGGPCPPPGKPHRYFFRLFALDLKLDLKAGAARSELEKAMEGHVLGHTEWMGTYQR